LFEISLEDGGVLLEDLALVKQLDQTANLILRQVQDVFLLEIEILDEELDDFFRLLMR
jgi:hypothetical protein